MSWIEVLSVFQMGRREQLVILIILAALLFGGGYRYAVYKGNLASDQPTIVVAAEETEQSDVKPEEIVIHVSGEVAKPGVYHLLTGDRVIDAIEMAQPNAEADLDSLNLATPLADGQKISVPPKMELMAGDSAMPGGNTSQLIASTVNATGGKVNLNTADLFQLDTLPGIGPALAQRIIDYRQTNGGFKTIEDLKNVSGIGDKKYNDLKDMISIY
ncbi:helix-hairpin-helix domain-containing protein [Peptococcaceae bacterium 1198_IL3148]